MTNSQAKDNIVLGKKIHDNNNTTMRHNCQQESLAMQGFLNIGFST